MLYDASALIFLSTLSLRRATLEQLCKRGSERFLSTLSLRRATIWHLHQSFDGLISIHALLAESDRLLGRFFLAYRGFLSTLSLRRATDTSSLMRCQVRFLSTLSLRRATERECQHQANLPHFYPRSPCGERPSLPSCYATIRRFLSTLSLRRATVKAD